MRRRLIKIGVGLAALGGLALGGTALATGGGGDSTTGPGADQASAAALAELGGGKANSVERDSENGAAWEVEVTKTDGTTVDVRLDADYKVVVVEGDSEQGGSPGSESEQDGDADGGASDPAEAEQSGAETEAPGDDGPNGHADEPGDPDADHQFEGNE